METRSMTKPIFVSDHAVLRYLERAMAVPVDQIRAHIATICTPAATAGAANVEIGNLCFCFATNPHGRSVTTVLERGMQKSRESIRTTPAKPSTPPEKPDRKTWTPHRRRGRSK